MKKIIAIILCAVMVLSVIPMVTLTASAAGEGDWITKRAPKEEDNELEEGEKYMPAPGYHYDNEGFHTDSPNYKDVAPMFYVRTREAYNLQEGLHLEYRVDEYEYKGTDEDGNSLGKDQWFCISIFPGENMTPGSPEYGSGWLILIRGEGNGKAQIEPHWTTGRNEDGTGGSFGACGGFVQVDVPTDSEGKEIYTFDVQWNGTTYDMTMNGVSINGGDAKLPETIPDGMCYVTIAGQTQIPDKPISMTILDWNGNTPTGSDSKEPDENVNSYAEFTPSEDIPAGQPAFRWDGNCTCMRKLPETGHDCNIAAKGDGSVHLTANGSLIYFGAGPSSSYSYHAEDFPVLAMLVRNYPGDNGQLWYCAGDIVGAQNDAVVSWDMYDEDYSKEYEVGDDLYNLILVDMKFEDEERWTGRIHGQRLVFTNLTPDDEEYGEFDLMYFAAFRSVDEAKAYADGIIKEINGGVDVTEAPTDAPTEKPTTPATEAPTGGDATEAPTTADGETLPEGATIVDGTDTGATDDTGCASVIGGSVALILTAIAAAVALKKKN